MNQGQTIFSQLMEFLPLHEFRQCVDRYQGNYRLRTFSCLDQFYCMAFAQLTFRESLRDIEACLRSMSTKLYHMGFRGKVSRNTLAKANENRDWHIYADFAQVLMKIAKELYVNEEFIVDLDQAAYALDSTMIDLCISIFPWAHWYRQQGALKLHTLLGLKGNVPVSAKLTNATVNDFEFLDDIIPEPGAFYIMDRGFTDLSRLFSLHQNSGFFVIREKSRINWRRLYSKPVDKSVGLRCDQTVMFSGRYSAKDYPEKLRRIRFFDSKNNRYFIFLTNNFVLPAITITQLYQCRWQVEIFFKWIKQHLRIKAFFGTSENAVKTQICIAISVYVLIAIVKKRLNMHLELYTFLQILSVSIFEKVDIPRLEMNDDYINRINTNHNQLELFNF
jgi:hypothetical protein